MSKKIYQNRTRLASSIVVRYGWGGWTDITESNYNKRLKEPTANGWEFQVRVLYTKSDYDIRPCLYDAGIEVKYPESDTYVRYVVADSIKDKPPLKQYYYHASGCPADDSDSVDCTCWHDEGTGVCNTSGTDDKLLLWRDKPN